MRSRTLLMSIVFAGLQLLGCGDNLPGQTSCEDPASPTVQVAAEVCADEVADVVATWTPTPDYSYSVEFWDGEGWQPASSVGEGTATQVDVPPGTDYKFRITTTNVACGTSSSAESSNVAVAAKPANPILPSPTDVCGESFPLTITWDDLPDVSYKAELWDGSDWIPATVVGDTATTEAVGSATDLKWRIQASRSSCSSGEWSESETFDVNVCAVGWVGGGLDGWNITEGTATGVGYKSFNFPQGIAFDSGGAMYVSEGQNNRVSKWAVHDHDSNPGTPDVMAAVGWIGGGQNGWQTGDAPSSGSDYQSFDNPWGIEIDDDGNIYVAEWGNNRVSKWDSNGNAIGWIGGGNTGWQTGSAPGVGGSYDEFNRPEGLALDAAGNLYVADYNNHRVSKWGADGSVIGWIGGGLDGWQTSGDAAADSGTSYKHFDKIVDVDVGADGSIYVADTNNDRLSKWSSGGVAVGWIGGGSDGWQTGDAPSAGVDMRSFEEPYAVQEGPNGDLFVFDYIHNRLCKWLADGTAVGWIGQGSTGWQTGNSLDGGSSYGSAYDWFMYPYGGLSVTADGFFVADSDNARVSWWR